MKISKQVNKDKAIAKYELGTFCEQYGLPPIAPSNKKKKSQIYHKYSNKYSGRQYPTHNKYKSKNKHFKTNKFYEKPKSNKWKRKPSGKLHSKNPEQKGNCYKCGKYGH